VISANVSERALACRAQSGGIQEISAAAVQVDQRTQKNVELFHGTTFPGQNLLREAQELSAAIACFVLQRAGRTAPSRIFRHRSFRGNRLAVGAEEGALPPPCGLPRGIFAKKKGQSAARGAENYGHCADQTGESSSIL
jgi:hypothetical protein